VTKKQEKKKNIERKREREKEIKVLLWKNEDKGQGESAKCVLKLGKNET
jgi:hypothetical protein